MLWFGVDAHISSLASTYVIICIPGVLFYSWLSCYNRFLVGQRITIVNMYGNIAGTVVHWILAPTLTLYFDMGIVGVSISSSL